MPDVYGGSFANDGAGYDAVQMLGATGSNTANLLLLEQQIDHLKALIPGNSAGQTAIHPDFRDIPPHTAEKLRAEIEFLKTAITV